MRTTLVLNDQLVLEVKKRAAEQGLTFSAVVETALRKSLESLPLPSTDLPFALPTFRPVRFTSTTISSAEIQELESADDLSAFES